MRLRFLIASFTSLALVPTLFACDLAGGLTDLGDSLLVPDAALLDEPGRKIVSGRYTSLVLDGSLENGGFVLALRLDTPEQRLAIVPFLKGEGCEVKNAIRFERLSSRVDVALSGLVAVQTTENESGRGKIRFVGFDCKDRMDALDDATLPRIEFPSSVPRGLLTLAGDQKLYLADADRARLDLVAENVSRAVVSADRIWSLEKGQLVARNSALDVIGEMGTNVTEFVPTSGDDPAVVYRDEDGLHLWSVRDGASLLDAEGCSALPLDPSTIAYFSPCESRRLVISLRGSKIGSSVERVKLLGPEGAVNHGATLLSFGSRDDISRFVFTTATDANQVSGRLYSAEIDPKNLGDEDTLALELVELSGNAAIIQGNLFENWDGAAGDIAEIDEDDDQRARGLTRIAERVAQVPGGSPFSARGVLVRYDGKTGDLVQLTRKGDNVEEKILVKDVPIQQQTVESDTSLVSFVGELKGNAGQVYLLDDGKTQVVAKKAYPGTVRFLSQPRALAYLGPSGDTTKLSAYLIEAGLEQTIHVGATEYRIVPWPSPGILYSVPEGEDRGLWFSKAR